MLSAETAGQLAKSSWSETVNVLHKDCSATTEAGIEHLPVEQMQVVSPNALEQPSLPDFSQSLVSVSMPNTAKNNYSSAWLGFISSNCHNHQKCDQLRTLNRHFDIHWFVRQTLKLPGTFPDKLNFKIKFFKEFCPLKIHICFKQMILKILSEMENMQF